MKRFLPYLIGAIAGIGLAALILYVTLDNLLHNAVR